MSPITVIITVACYFALLLGVSWLSSRGSRGADNASFFTGSRKAPWPVVAFAMIGAAISGVTFISVPGMVAAKSYSYLQMVLGFIVGYAVISMVLVPVFYRQGLVSIYGYLDSRFGKASYRSGAWIFFISKMLGASVRFFVVCAVLQILVFTPLGIPFAVNVMLTIALIWLYTVRGGENPDMDRLTEKLLPDRLGGAVHCVHCILPRYRHCRSPFGDSRASRHEDMAFRRPYVGTVLLETVCRRRIHGHSHQRT